MARSRRQRRAPKVQTIDPTLVADFELSLSDVPMPADILSAEKLSGDQRRLHRSSVPLPPSSELQTVPLHADTAAPDHLFLGGQLFNAEDPFFTPNGLDDAGGETWIEEGLAEGARPYLASQDEPMKAWIPKRDEYLHELLRLEGRGGYARNRCESCPDGETANEAVIRCCDCSPRPLCCGSCAVRQHAHTPYHRFQRWERGVFVITSLKELGLTVRLGHAVDGYECSNPVRTRADFSVVHVNGRHNVSVMFCGCDKAGEAGNHVQQLLRYRLYPATDSEPNTAFTFDLLEHYHIQSLQGKISMYDYYTSLERLTDNTGTLKLQDRYRGFMRVVAQWRHLKRLKRCGRGHDISGVEGTSPGELAVRCPACPRPNVNLPPNWDTVSDDLRFLYIMTVAIDACFRLKRRAVSNTGKDPILGSGWGYFVEDTGYQEVLRGYGNQDEMSTCTGLSAIDHANSKYSKGYAATGIGAVVCARHEFWLALGAGDLQLGERYINMDYIYVCALREYLVLNKIVSYDIACQWSKNILERIRNLPSHIQIPVPEGSVVYAIPKLHYGSHQQAGHSKFSLNYRVGSARTDGEGIERRWWWIQPIANSTKVMGPGMRQGVLEDQWGYSNWRKMVDLPWTLSARLKDALAEAHEQKIQYEVLTERLNDEHIVLWEAEIEEWEANPEECDDPYVVTSQGMTEAETVQTLSEEEQATSAMPGFVALHSVSVLGFLTCGLEIEGQQARLIEDVKSVIPSKLAEIHERRTSLRRKIQKYRELQAVYMPVATSVLAEDDACRTDVQHVELIRIGLPSEISASRRTAVCSARLIEMEIRLRTAQCRDALQDIRNKLHTIDQLYNYKKLNVRNQGPNTRARNSIAQQEARKLRAVQKYRRARHAVAVLSGPGDWELEFKLLRDEDVRGIEDDDPAVIEKRKRKRGDKSGPAEGRRRMLWIWHTSNTDGPQQITDSLRVEWLKSRARHMRWQEEIKLLPEEMRRVLATHRHEAEKWHACAKASAAASSDPLVQEGLTAYASTQASIRLAMAQVLLRVCQPLAKKASSGSGPDWEGWSDIDADGAAVDEGADDYTDYISLYQLDGEDMEPSYHS
ncbi:hypothetical protein C2E23DRAFT_872607 [Lenzites betulinus]|nr:hypothetical protein C2E23DRAFT_872607 [Lenzites betulinus]